MSLQKPSISIGLPVYNGERYIASAIDSILKQTFVDFEIIISDNASIDNTAGICKKYCSKDSRVKYFRNNKNLGSAKNFNRVFELSSGDYFRWHSADDLCAPTLLEECKKVLDTKKSIALCAPRTILIDETGDEIKKLTENLSIHDSNARDRLEKLHLNLKLCNAQYGLMRSEIVRRTGLEGDYPGSDIIFLSEMCLYGKFEQLDEYLFFRRWHNEASSHLDTTEAQQQFWDPDTSGKFFMREWKHILEHLRIIGRASLALNEKIKVAALVLKWIRWNRTKLYNEAKFAIQYMLSY